MRQRDNVDMKQNSIQWSDIRLQNNKFQKKIIIQKKIKNNTQ